jgi:hydroxyquinol 1,2-dioxygenase
MPTAYPAPMDAALGDLIRNTTGRFWRPARLHFAVETKTADALATHIFVRGSEQIDCDVAFGARPALITDFTEHAPGLAPDGREMNGAYRMLNYDFVMTRSGRWPLAFLAVEKSSRRSNRLPPRFQRKQHQRRRDQPRA